MEKLIENEERMTGAAHQKMFLRNCNFIQIVVFFGEILGSQKAGKFLWGREDGKTTTSTKFSE